MTEERIAAWTEKIEVTMDLPGGKEAALTEAKGAKVVRYRSHSTDQAEKMASKGPTAPTKAAMATSTILVATSEIVLASTALTNIAMGEATEGTPVTPTEAANMSAMAAVLADLLQA